MKINKKSVKINRNQWKSIEIRVADFWWQIGVAVVMTDRSIDSRLNRIDRSKNRPKNRPKMADWCGCCDGRSLDWFSIDSRLILSLTDCLYVSSDLFFDLFLGLFLGLSILCWLTVCMFLQPACASSWRWDLHPFCI